MKLFNTFIILQMIITALSSCQEKTNLVIETKEVNKIEIYYFNDFGLTGIEHFKNIVDTEHIKTTIGALNETEKMKGEVDMPFGDYNIKIIYSNGIEKEFHLWIHDQYAIGTLMEINDTATAYNLSKKATEQVREVLYK